MQRDAQWSGVPRSLKWYYYGSRFTNFCVHHVIADYSQLTTKAFVKIGHMFQELKLGDTDTVCTALWSRKPIPGDRNISSP
jgi:hypothetical protein